MEQTRESAGSSDYIQEELLGVSDKNIAQSVNLFSVLSSEDAMRIFLYAERGITSSTQAIKDLGITQKRYYSRLNGLIGHGLIEKVDGIYKYTAYGKIVHELGTYLYGIQNNIERIDILHQLSNANALSQDERYEISNMIRRNLEFGPLLGSIINGVDDIEIRKITEYDELVKIILEDINSAEKSVLLASNYLEPSVVEAHLKATRRGVEFRVIMSAEATSRKINKLKLILSPKILMNFLEFIKSQRDNDAWFREGEIPFSFCIIDDHVSIFELPSVGAEFSIAFYLRDESTSNKFSKLFEKIWTKSGEIDSDFVSRLF